MKKFFTDERTIPFLISLLIAFGLWLLIKLSGDFQTDQKVYLHFQNFPIDKVLINKPDSVLQIRTHNNGFDVLSQFLFNRNKSLDIDFSRAKHLESNNNIQIYYILSSALNYDIEDEFKTAEQILSVRPDSIVFKFENLASKKLKIEPQLKISFNRRFKQYKKMLVEPDSILFFGPVSILNSIHSINTQAFNLQDISASIDTILNLEIPNSKLIGAQSNIKLKIAVEEYTEGKVSLPIQLKGRSRIHYKVFPSEAQITYQVALKDYSKISPSDFDLSAIPDSTESGKLYLHLSRQPENVIVSNIQPSTAEYIIFK